ncbi:hypothetical protein H0H87_003920, partial [Tephrocybe sp. NHM501043]
MWSFELERPDAVAPEQPEETTEENNTIDDKKVSELVEIYEQILREEFEDAQQSREERSEDIRRELLREAGQDNTSKDPVQKVAELFEKYEGVLWEALEAIEQQRREHNEKKRQDLLAEANKVAGGGGSK